jgi:pimeloyl-ACP methyl ester carboxylesterase
VRPWYPVYAVGIRWGLVAVALAVFAGCGGSKYSRLVRQDNVAVLARLNAAYVEAGNHTTMVETRGVSRTPIQMALHEVGVRGDRELLVLVHGVFSDHRMWRFVAGDLAKDYDLLLVDLPGCGASERADPDKCPESTYTVSDMTRRLLEALRQYLSQRPSPPGITLVAHSYAGAMAIRAFGDSMIREDFRDVVEEIDRLILFAPLDVAVEKAHPILIELSRISGIRVWSALQTGLLKERVAELMLANSHHPHRALREEADAKIAILTDWATRRAMQATLTRAVPMKGSRPDWEKIDKIVATYALVDRPCLIVWGVHDEVLPVSMGYKLAAQLPRTKLVTIPDGMHSFPLEQPEEALKVVREFLKGDETKK